MKSLTYRKCMISVFSDKTEWQYENPADVLYEEDRASNEWTFQTHPNS